MKKILIIGYGNIAKRHIKNLKVLLHGDCLFYVYKGMNRGNIFNINDDIQFVNSLAELDGLKFYCAIISSPSSKRAEAYKYLVGQDIPIFVEKPILSDFVFDFNISKFLESDILVGYNLRYLNTLKKFKEFIDLRICGKPLKINIISSSNLAEWRSDSNYSQTASARKDLGGGALLELSHEIDYLLWIFGMPDIIFGTLEKLSLLNIDVEDSAEIICRYSNIGLLAHLSLNFFHRDKISRKCFVYCEDGSIECDLIDFKITINNFCTHKSEIILFEEKIDDTYVREIRDFIDMIEYGRTPGISFEDGLNVLKFVNAVRQSHTSGSRINMGL
jgi:hypothetical protein